MLSDRLKLKAESGAQQSIDLVYRSRNSEAITRRVLISRALTQQQNPLRIRANNYARRLARHS